jgi:uncharacterized protein with PCYCGC motif
MKPLKNALKGIALLLMALLVACSPITRTVTLAPESALPGFMKMGDMRTKEAYQFAIAHPHETAKYPCYCGCVAMGHKSNLDCYIKAIADDGTITFDDHASGCGVCVDITQDVIRMMREGKRAPEIRAYIDATYSSRGPSTNTPLPTE